MRTDDELLRAYLENHSEEAFAALVERYGRLVYSAALRQVRGDVHLAEDVTQAVFSALIQKGPALTRHSSLIGWLYTCVRYTALNELRSHRRRKDREEEYAMKAVSESAPDESDWTRLGPVLDEAMHSLGEQDRKVILLRYFERKRLNEIALNLGVNESAARKRVDRAVDKLRRTLLRQGAAFSASALIATLEANAVTDMPASIAARLTAGSIIATSTLNLPIMSTMIITKLQIAAGLAFLALSGAVVHQARTIKDMRGMNESLRQQVTQAESLPQPGSQAPPEASLSSAERSELLRLRGDVGVLKAELAEARNPGKAPKNSAAATPVQWQDRPEQEPMRRMQAAQEVVLAFYKYADQNGGLLPTNVLQVSDLILSQKTDTEALNYLTNHFEVVYQDALTNASDPGRTIILREKEPWPAIGGGWNRVYSFADGHTEVHKSPDGDFTNWEQRLGLPQ